MSGHALQKGTQNKDGTQVEDATASIISNRRIIHQKFENNHSLGELDSQPIPVNSDFLDLLDHAQRTHRHPHQRGRIHTDTDTDKKTNAE